MSDWKVYLLECSDGTYYCGITNREIAARINTHNSGKGAKYTRGRIPVSLICYKSCLSRNEAAKLEIKVKKLPRQKKIAVFGT